MRSSFRRLTSNPSLEEFFPSPDGFYPSLARCFPSFAGFFPSLDEQSVA
ncbi:hypothetical protein ABH966_003806 [Lysinibacillus sp. RC46]